MIGRRHCKNCLSFVKDVRHSEGRYVCVWYVTFSWFRFVRRATGEGKCEERNDLMCVYRNNERMVLAFSFGARWCSSCQFPQAPKKDLFNCDTPNGLFGRPELIPGFLSRLSRFFWSTGHQSQETSVEHAYGTRGGSSESNAHS